MLLKSASPLTDSTADFLQKAGRLACWNKQEVGLELAQVLVQVPVQAQTEGQGQGLGQIWGLVLAP